jgi:hypothetical protein
MGYGEIRNRKTPTQCPGTYFMCMRSWLHWRELWDTYSPRPSDRWGLFKNLIFCPKPVHSADDLRASPRRNDGASRICAPAQVLGEVRRRSSVRKGVDVRQVYGIVVTDAAVLRIEGFMSGRKRRGMESGWTGFKEERLSGRYRLVEIKVAVQFAKTSRGGEIGGGHQGRSRRDRGQVRRVVGSRRKRRERLHRGRNGRVQVEEA